MIYIYTYSGFFSSNSIRTRQYISPQSLGLSSLTPQTAVPFIVVDSDSDSGGAADNDNDDVDQHSDIDQDYARDTDSDDLETASDPNSVTKVESGVVDTSELPEQTTDEVLQNEHHSLSDVQSQSHQQDNIAESAPIPAPEIPETHPDPVPHVEEPQRAPKRMRREAGQSVPALGISREKKYSSPDILRQLAPPGCSIRLNTNEHRFTSAWKPAITCDAWVDELSNKTYSQSFNVGLGDDWKSKLAEVHSFAWTKWSIAVNFCAMPELTLPTGAVEQTPGRIPEDVYQVLSPLIQSLPDKKQYSKLGSR